MRRRPCIPDRIRRAIGPRVVDAIVDPAAQQFALVRIAEHAQAGLVAQDADAVLVQCVDTLRGGVQEQAEACFPLEQGLPQPVLLRDVLGKEADFRFRIGMIDRFAGYAGPYLRTVASAAAYLQPEFPLLDT